MRLPLYGALAVVAGFASGFLARGEYTEGRDVAAKVSEVAVEHGRDAEAMPQAVSGLAPGVAMRLQPDGRTVPEDEDRITALDAHDPASMVMAPASVGGRPCPSEPACDCSQDSLHRYEFPRPRRKDLQSLPPARKKG